MKDQVCLQKTSRCIDPFTFFLVSDQHGIPDEADGILGLTLGGNTQGFNMPGYYTVSELYLDLLRVMGYISEKSFSTHFTGLSGNSFIEFGPYKETYMSSIDEYVEIPVSKGYFYTGTPQGVRFGSGDAYALDGS